MTVRYQILFSIEVMNTYFSQSQWRDIVFIPLPETQQLLNTMGYQLRRVRNQLLVIAPVKSDETALKLPELYTRFSFALQPQSPGYQNFTNILMNETGGMQFYYFHNNQANQVGAINYLTAPITSYQNSATYIPGDFSRGADGKTYESIKVNAGAQAPDDMIAASKNFWTLMGDQQYVHKGDIGVQAGNNFYPYQVTGPQFNIRATVSLTAHRVWVYGRNPVSEKFDRLVMQDIVKFDQPTDNVQVNLQALPTGVYRVEVDADIYFVYRMTPEVDAPMIVEIYHLPKTAPNSFLNPDDTLKNIKYTIQFSSRKVYWRYKTRTNAINKIVDTNGEYIFDPDGARFFISQRPIPLSEAPRKTLTANTNALVITSPLPNPRVDRLDKKRNEVFTSESYINY